MSLTSGDRLLHFKIIHKIGQGGMGEVYLAEDNKLGRRVAVKVLPAVAAEGEKAKLRLMQEARSASALNHPNIVTIHSIEEENGIIFIVMEYVEGETLSSRLQHGFLPLTNIIDINSQIADGLAAAHDAGVIHRDIKSSNILLTRNGRVKILDFGLAKQTLPAEDLPTGIEEITEAGTILGTVAYMSPEQVRGEPLDLRSDIFSFGCVLYECATGRLPFRGPSPTAVMYQITTAQVIPPSSLRPDLPLNFDAIVLRALAKDKGFRYSSARELGEDLRATGFPETVALSITTPVLPAAKRDDTFVGREQELQDLQNVFQLMLQSSGTTAFLTGEPGIGKTAIAEEFLRRVATTFPDLVIARGRCVEHYGTGEAYLPFLDAIGGILSSAARVPMIQVLQSHAPTWCTQFPAAFTSTGVFEASQKEASAASKERMLREISDALLELAARSPLLLFLEDLHWADPSSADLLRYLSRRVKGHRVLILGTLREEDLETGNPPMKACRLDLQAHSISHEIHIHLLPEALVKDYLNRLYSPNIFPQELSGLIFRKTEGHPLFVTSLTQFLASQNIIIKEGNTWALGRSLSDADLEMPENVKSMIRRKIDALSEEERKTLQFASVEGQEFHSIILAGLLAVDEIALEENLSKLERSHRIIRKTEEEDWPDGSIVTKYRFTHALYQNALYADLVTKRRVQLHKLAGDSLLNHHASQTRAIANQLALHFQLGRDFEKAMHFLTQAADQARAVFANTEAAELYGKALQQARELLARDPVRWKMPAASLREKLGDALAMLGKQEEAKQEFLEAQKLLEASDLLARARLHRKTAKAVETIRQFTEAFQEYAEARRLLDSELDSQSLEWQQEWIQVNVDQTWLHYTQNQPEPMQALMDLTEPYLERAGTPTQKVRFYQCSILLGYRRDRYRISEQTMDLIDRSRKAAEEWGLQNEVAMLNFVTGFASLWRNDLQRSEHYFQLGLSQAIRLEDAVLQSRFLAYIPVLYRKQNDVEQTRSRADESLKFSTAINMKEYIAIAKANLGWAHLRSGEVILAKQECTEAVEIWRSLPLVSPFQELALWPLIAIALQEQDIAAAIAHAGAILDPSQRQLEQGVESLLKRALTSPVEEARDFLQQAVEIVRTGGYVDSGTKETD